MITYGYWSEAPVTVNGGVAREEVHSTSSLTSGTTSGTYTYGSTGVLFSSTAADTFTSVCRSRVETAQLTTLNIFLDATQGYGDAEVTVTKSEWGNGGDTSQRSYSSSNLDPEWSMNYSVSADRTTRQEDTVLWFSRTSNDLSLGGTGYSVTEYTTTGRVYTIRRSESHTQKGTPLAWGSTDHPTRSDSYYSTYKDAGDYAITDQGAGSSTTNCYYLDADDVTSTRLSVEMRTSTGYYFQTYERAYPSDDETKTENQTVDGTVTRKVTLSSTVKSFDGGSVVSTLQTYTAATSMEGTLESEVLVSTEGKVWSNRSDVERFVGSRMSLATVYIVEASDALMTRRGKELGIWPPGTTTRTQDTVGVAGGDYCVVTSESEYAYAPGCGENTTTYSYFGYASYTSTVTTVTSTVVVRASARGSDTLPLDGALRQTLSSGGSTTISFRLDASSGPTYTYSYSGYGDKRSTMESAFTTGYGYPFLLLDSDGNPSWATSSYTVSNSPLTIIVLGNVSGTDSWSATRSTSRDLWGRRTTQSTTESSTTASFCAGTTVWGSKWSYTLASYTTYYADSYWTYTHDGEAGRCMLGFSVPRSVGFRGDPGQGLGSNIIADEYPPTASDNQAYSTQALGGGVIAFRGSGIVRQGTDTYSTTFLAGNSYRVSSSDWTTARTCVYGAVGSPSQAVSWAEYKEYAASNLPTFIGCGSNVTVSLMFHSWTWYSRMALAYTSVNTVSGGTTRGTLGYSPLCSTLGTTLGVGSANQVAFRWYPYALSTSQSLVQLQQTTENFYYDGVSTYDPWG